MGTSPSLRRGRLLTTREAAEVATVSERTIRRAIGSHKLTATRIGGAVRVSEYDLGEFIEACREEFAVEAETPRPGRRRVRGGRPTPLRVAEPPPISRVIT